MSFRFFAVAVAVILATVCVSAAYNDRTYPNAPTSACSSPQSKFRCGTYCNQSSGSDGRWLIPLKGQCTVMKNLRTSPNSVFCVQPSIKRYQCCNACLNVSTCQFWQHYVQPGPCSDCGICYLHPAAAEPPKCHTDKDASGRLSTDATTLGRPCAAGKNDPHFRGAEGTHFEFNGLPDQSFCLLTDRLVHVNMLMRGYFDSRTVGATVLRGGKAVRTWIRELGALWVDAAGVQHSLRIAARDGKSSTRGAGFVKEIDFDGAKLAPFTLGESRRLPGGLKLSLVAHEKTGGGFFDVDVYSVSILGRVNMEVKLRVAHPLLQTASDAMAHINVAFVEVNKTRDVHGVMGQTFRAGREQRALKYGQLSEVVGRPFAADAEEGRGYLDGEVAAYRTSGVLQADCAYSAFNGRQLPSIPGENKPAVARLTGNQRSKQGPA